METCEECGRPLAECSAATVARGEAERHLRKHGYSGVAAREAAGRLVPERD